MRVEFANGKEALSEAKVAAFFSNEDVKNGGARLSQLRDELPNGAGERVHAVLVDGMPESFDEYVKPEATATVTFVAHISDDSVPSQGVGEFVAITQGTQTRPPKLDEWQRDSESVPVQQLLDAFREARRNAAAKKGAAAAATDTSSGVKPVLVGNVMRFAKVLVLASEMTQLRKTIEAAETKIARRRKKREKRAARAAAPPEPKPEPEQPPAVDHVALLEELRSRADAAGGDGIVAMGFTPEATLRAMLENSMQADLAVNFILGATDIESLGTPLSEEQIERFAVRYLPPESTRALHAAAAAPAQSTFAPNGEGIQEESSDSEDERAPPTPRAQSLIEMGFDRDQAERALSACRGEVAVAAEALLDGRTFDAPAELEGERPWTMRLESRLLELEAEAAASVPPREPVMTPAQVLEVAEALTADPDKVQQLRRAEPGLTVFRELEQLFLPPAPPPGEETITTEGSFMAHLDERPPFDIDEVMRAMSRQASGAGDDDVRTQMAAQLIAAMQEAAGGQIQMEEAMQQLAEAAREASDAAAAAGEEHDGDEHEEDEHDEHDDDDGLGAADAA